MTTLLLIRHGETDWNKEGRLQGQSDILLNALGLEQARQTAARLIDASLSAIYASDLRRAVQTAEAIGLACNLPVQLDPRLREVHLGEWQGRLVSELNDTGDERFANRFRYPSVVAPPGGEASQQVQARLLAAVDDIVARHPGETVAVVTHGFAVAALIAAFRNIPLDQVWELIPSNGQIEIIEKSAASCGTYKKPFMEQRDA
jgi:broad specificity phosphatase PhoE